MRREKQNEKELSFFNRRIQMIWILILACIMSCVIFLQPISTNAQEDSSGQKVVRVGYYTAPGFQEYDEENDVYSGSSYEYLMAIKQYTGWEYEFIPVQFSEGVQMLQNGELDLMNNVSKTAEREQTMGFSSYASGSNYGCLIVPMDNTTYAYNDFDSFDKMQVGILTTSIFRPFFEEFCEEHDINPEIISFDTDDEMTEALKRGEIDARIVSSSYQDGSRIVAKFAPMDYYFAVPKAENDLLEQLNDAMRSIQTDMPDFQQEIDKRYQTKYSEQNVILSKAEKKYLLDTPVVKVAVSDAWYPISYFAKDGTYSGPLADIYRRIEDATGLEFEFDKYDNYELALQAVTDRKADMIAEFPYDFIYADQWSVQLSDMVNDVSVYRVMKENFSDTEIKTIALYGESYLETRIEKLYGDDVEYDMYESAEDAVDAVRNGKADCTFLNYYRATSFQNKGKYITLKYVLIPSLQYNFGLGVSEYASPELKSLIGKGLTTIDSEYIESEFQAAAQQNMTPDMEAFMLQNSTLFIVLLAVIVAVIVILAAFFIYSRRIKNKNVELERAKKAQSEFLSRMSHDMRTPMNGILGLSYLMEKEKNIDVLKSYIPELQESSNFLLQLINDVLDVNKIESGNLTLNSHTCDEEKVFDSIIDMMRPLMEEKNIDFHFEKINIDWQFMLLDEQRVKQIFINLLNNAVKFTPEGGKIELIMELIWQTEDMIRDKFIIRDTGIGISKEFLPHIFEPFKQEAGANIDYTKGTGLGLPIVKQLVELMGGSIAVKSEKGKGTEITIYLNLPLAQRPERIQETVREEKNTVKAERSQMIPQGLQILLCEDHPLNATIATKLLEQQGAIVTWTKNGKDGVGVFANSKIGSFDVILMDIRMPEMDGLEATRKIRALDREDAKVIPIIAMSANAYEEDVEKSLEAGMNAHLAKPIEPTEMYSEIRKYVEKYGK